MTAASALDKVNETLPLMKQMVDTDNSLQPRMTDLEEIVNGLEELAREIHAYGDNLNFDPERLKKCKAGLS